MAVTSRPQEDNRAQCQNNTSQLCNGSYCRLNVELSLSSIIVKLPDGGLRSRKNSGVTYALFLNIRRRTACCFQTYTEIAYQRTGTVIQLTTMTAKNFLKTRICWICLWSEECIKCRRNYVENKNTEDTMRFMSPYERTPVQTLIPCAEWQICVSTHPYGTFHSVCVCLSPPAYHKTRGTGTK